LNLALTDDQLLLQKSVREFAESESKAARARERRKKAISRAHYLPSRRTRPHRPLHCPKTKAALLRPHFYTIVIEEISRLLPSRA